MLFWILLCAAGSCILLHVLQIALKLRRRWLKAVEAPSIPKSLPFIGHALRLLGDCEHLQKILEEVSAETCSLGGVAKAWLGPSLFYFITNPEDALLVSNACLRKHWIYRFGSQFFCEGLVTSNRKLSNPEYQYMDILFSPAPKWHQHRKLLTPSFNSSVLDEFIPIFNRQSARLVFLFEDKVGHKNFDHFPILMDIALETICQTAIGLDKNEVCVVNEKYREAINSLFNCYALRIPNVFLHSDFIYNFTRTKKKEADAIKVLLKKSSDVLQMRRASKTAALGDNNKGRKFKAFLDLILEIEEEHGWTVEEIREETDTIIGAGSDTTAKSMTLILIYLGSYPEIQEKLYNEIKGVLGDSDADITKDDLTKLIYTEAVIKETLRVCPTVPFIIREVDSDVKTSKCTIPAGTAVILSLWGVQRSPCWGPDAYQFRPERWFEPLPAPPSFAAFSLGKRNCIGKVHAMMAMKTMLAYVIRRYKIQADHTKLRLNLDLTIRPIAGHHITIELRKKL